MGKFSELYPLAGGATSIAGFEWTEKTADFVADIGNGYIGSTLNLAYINSSTFNGFYNYIGTNGLSSAYVNPTGGSVTISPSITNTNYLLDKTAGAGGWVEYGTTPVTITTINSIKIEKILLHFVAGLSATIQIQQLEEGIWVNIGSINVNDSFTYQSTVVNVTSTKFVNSIRLSQSSGIMRLSEIELFGEIFL